MFKTLTPIFALIIAAGLGFTYVQPTLVDIKALQTEEKEYQSTIEKASRLKQSIDQKKAEINSFDSVAISRLETMVPDEVDPVLVIMNLDALAQQHVLELSNIKITEPVKQEAEVGGSSDEYVLADEGLLDTENQTATFAEAPLVIPHEIGFTLTGTYEDFSEFLVSLEKSLEFFEVSALDFLVTEGDLLSFSLVLHTYTFNSET